jgi:hypothetical protein
MGDIIHETYNDITSRVSSKNENQEGRGRGMAIMIHIKAIGKESGRQKREKRNELEKRTEVFVEGTVLT